MRWQLAVALSVAVEPRHPLAASQPPAAERPARVGGARGGQPCARPCRPSRPGPGCASRRIGGRTAAAASRGAARARAEVLAARCAPGRARTSAASGVPVADGAAPAPDLHRSARASHARFARLPLRNTTMCSTTARRAWPRSPRSGPAAAPAAASRRRPARVPRPRSWQRRHGVELDRAAAERGQAQACACRAQPLRGEQHAPDAAPCRAGGSSALRPSMVTRSRPPFGSLRPISATPRAAEAQPRRRAAPGRAHARCRPTPPCARAASSRRENAEERASRSSIGISRSLRSPSGAVAGAVDRGDPELVLAPRTARGSGRVTTVRAAEQRAPVAGASRRRRQLAAPRRRRWSRRSRPRRRPPARRRRWCARWTVAGVTVARQPTARPPAGVLSLACTAPRPAGRRTPAAAFERTESARVAFSR